MTLFKNYKSSLRSVLSFFAISASLTFVSCQDEDFGYDQSEIRQAFLNRKYAEEFKKQFPNADPNHTWMCDPDTFGIESLVGTRAYPTGVPTISNMNQTVTKDNDFITSALKTLGEGDDNRGKVTQSFEYLAAEDDGDSNTDNKSEFIVTPTFWGRKFVDTNAIGVYYTNEDGTVHHDLEPFWNDTDKRGIYVTYNDNYRELVPASDQQITDEPMWANHERNTKKFPNNNILKLGHKCSYCGINIIAHEASNNSRWEKINKTINDHNAKYITMTTGSSTPWDTQLIVTTPNKTWHVGEDFALSFRYWVSETQTVRVELQSEPGTRVCDAYVRNNDFDNSQIKAENWKLDGGYGQYCNPQTVTLETSVNGDWKNETGWKEITIYGKIPQKDADGKDVSGIKTIVLNLSNKAGVEYRFSEINWVYRWGDDNTNKGYHTNAGYSTICDGGSGKYLVKSYELPQYKLEVPVGMKFGFYLETKKQQNGSETVRWYSNADFNEKTTNTGGNISTPITGNVSAAATYVGTDKTVYCCFEDAACKLHDYQNPNPNNGDNWTEGKCYCGYGHYDTDYNDIVLSIKGSPVITSYTAVKYRVMCEDLGGTYDWDFNDVVYDVVYEEDPQGRNNATVKVLLQAVGGTLPVSMQFAGAFGSENIIANCTRHYNSDNSLLDLHKNVYSQNPNQNGLYLPVNVANVDNTQQTEWKNGQDHVLCTYTLNAKRYPGLDARRFVELITIYVNQDPKKNNTTTSVTFPTQKGGTNTVPECFMTSINTGWTNEHENIANRFYGFMNWVGNHNSNKKWWEDGIGM